MKVFFISFASLFMCGLTVLANAAVETATTSSAVLTKDAKDNKKLAIGILDLGQKQIVEEKLLGFISNQLKSCNYCEVKNLTPYSEKGEVNFAALPATLDPLSAQLGILYVNWNEKMSDKNKSLLESLSKLSASGVIVILPPGDPPAGDAAAPLNKTLAGLVPDALIVGERNERDRLVTNGFYGPEMLTAIRPPKDLMGQGVSAPLFMTKLASQWPKRSPQEWVSYFKGKKSGSRKLWLDLEDFFGR